MNNNCDFCLELQNTPPQDTELYAQVNKCFPINRFFLQTKHWVLAPTVGCYLEGYTLAISKAHTLSLSNSPLSSQKEFSKLLSFMRNAFSEIYKSKLVFFEHGTIQKEYSSSSVDHAHIHFLPINTSLWNIFESEYHPDYYHLKDISQLESAIELYQLSSYLLFGDTDEQIYLIAPDPSKYQSQFFRKFIANHVDSAIQWNWKKEYYTDNMFKTYNSFIKYINSAQPTLTLDNS